ncbi:MAG: phenylacetate-CoA oxygenase subunit PaaJ [Actinomycetia bacterium]|nr:phenylacetate-CoA oxygenase subunit PaaJ [Actinomycetes bacterium]MCP3912758.1 phenylacetate-CoA oxygenase subunit PaaJ [Actinomycetes bacterium]MCP4086534.1 phenylacetate-CoA oxygenase subunit PaaJ [Actinomycetes bacterium]
MGRVRAAVAAVSDPEVPVLTIDDLGVLRSVEEADGRILVTITPTYSGCPAMQFIEDRIIEAVLDAGFEGEVRTVFSPAWTTDWMSDDGRRKLREYGIAPPNPVGSADETVLTIRAVVRCPRCDSADTKPVSEFGSTACKALYQCNDCHEPFDYFKEL